MQENVIIERINSLCAAQGWTVYRLAKESGITYSTLNTMLHKANTPSLHTLKRICHAFKITLAQFFDPIDSEPPLSPTERALLLDWEKLSEKDQQSVRKYISFLLTENK